MMEKDWEIRYQITKARSILNASRDAASLTVENEAAPGWLSDRIKTDKGWPELSVTGLLVEEGDSEASQVMVYVVSDMPGQLFKELVDFMGIV